MGVRAATECHSTWRSIARWIGCAAVLVCCHSPSNAGTRPDRSAVEAASGVPSGSASGARAHDTQLLDPRMYAEDAGSPLSAPAYPKKEKDPAPEGRVYMVAAMGDSLTDPRS